MRDALTEAGFTDVTIATDILRKERLEDVAGLIVSAQRDALAVPATQAARA